VDDASGALLTTCGSCDKFTVSSENIKTFSDDYLILLKSIRERSKNLQFHLGVNMDIELDPC